MATDAETTDGILTERLELRLTPAEKATFVRAARRAGLSLSAWGRRCMNSGAVGPPQTPVGLEDRPLSAAANPSLLGRPPQPSRRLSGGD